MRQALPSAADRAELHDLSVDPEHADRLEFWRRRLIDHLAARGDGFSDRWGPGVG
ncbi:MAG: hypothetical protein R6V58_00365 [Planctomycetota bacterium]